jgi:hypothetical protein
VPNSLTLWQLFVLSFWAARTATVFLPVLPNQSAEESAVYKYCLKNPDFSTNLEGFCFGKAEKT